jgi:hypothetical protein
VQVQLTQGIKLQSGIRPTWEKREKEKGKKEK